MFALVVDVTPVEGVTFSELLALVDAWLSKAVDVVGMEKLSVNRRGGLDRTMRSLLKSGAAVEVVVGNLGSASVDEALEVADVETVVTSFGDDTDDAKVVTSLSDIKEGDLLTALLNVRS